MAGKLADDTEPACPLSRARLGRQLCPSHRQIACECSTMTNSVGVASEVEEQVTLRLQDIPQLPPKGELRLHAALHGVRV